MLAIVANDTVGVHALLAANTSPDESDEYGRTALIYAVMFDNVPVGQMLVGDGANLNIRDKLGKTALALGRGTRQTATCCACCWTPRPRSTHKIWQGLTPLMIAASNGKAEAVRLLLQYHADPRINDYTGHDAVDWAVKHPAIAQALKVAAAR